MAHDASELDEVLRRDAPDAPDGDPDAGPDFRSIFETECAFVWNTLRRLGVPERDVEDAAQEAFIVVHRHLRSYDPTRPLRPWLFGICYRVAIAHLRRARTRKERIGSVDGEPLDPVDHAQRADERLEANEDRALVQRALDALDLDRRALIVMVEWEGYTMPQVAETLGIPLNTAYSRLRLAREQFVSAVRRIQAKTAPRALQALARGGAR